MKMSFEYMYSSLKHFMLSSGLVQLWLRNRYLVIIKNKDFPTSLQTLRILIHTEDVEILGPIFGHLQFTCLQSYEESY